MKVDASGITVEKNLGLMSGFGVDFVCRGGWIFATTGQIFDPERGIQVGSFANTPVADDAASGRYYLVSSGALVAYDQNTRLPVGVTALPGVNGAAGSFIRWGTNGFALRVSSTKMRSYAHRWCQPRRRPTCVCPEAAAASGYGRQRSHLYADGLESGDKHGTECGPHTDFAGQHFLPFCDVKFRFNSGDRRRIGLFAAGGSRRQQRDSDRQSPDAQAGLLAAVASVTSDSLDPDLTNNLVKLEVPVATIAGPRTR